MLPSMTSNSPAYMNPWAASWVTACMTVPALDYLTFSLDSEDVVPSQGCV